MNPPQSSSLDRQQPGPSTSSHGLLNSINQRVDRVEVICKESEVIGTETLGELATQRESLRRTNERITGANRELDATNKNLRYMYLKIATNKFLLCFIILMELIIIAVQLYLKFFK